MGDTSYYYGRGAGVPQVQYGQAISYPATTQGPSPNIFNARAFKIYGAILALMAAATLSLGIADVVLTKEAYCNPWSSASPLWCSTTEEPYIWVWVASGIWASIPIFFAGIFAMCLSSNPGQWTRVFALLVFLSAIVFAPGMCVLSSIEVWRGSEAKYNFYQLKDGIQAGMIMPDDNPYLAKFAIPLVIAIMAGVMFIMTAVITLALCCCMHSLGIYLPQEIEMLSGGGVTQTTQVVQSAGPYVQEREVYYPSRPQIRTYDADPYAGFAPVQASVPVRYNPQSYQGAGASNVMYGNFASRAPPTAGGFANDFFKPNPAYFWQ